MESEGLTVIGYIGDLLADIYVANPTHIYSLRRAQRQPRDCSIQAVIVRNFARNTRD